MCRHSRELSNPNLGWFSEITNHIFSRILLHAAELCLTQQSLEIPNLFCVPNMLFHPVFSSKHHWLKCVQYKPHLFQINFILSFNVCSGLPSGLLSLGSSTEIRYITYRFSHTCSILSDLTTLKNPASITNVTLFIRVMLS